MMEHCSHGLSSVQPPSSFSTRIHRDECCYCFASSLDQGGIGVCLVCYHGGCPEHALLHYDKTGHSLVYWHAKKKLKVPDVDEGDALPPAKLSRVEILPTDPEPEYVSSGHVQCLQCSAEGVAGVPEACLQAILNPAKSAEHKARVQAWREETVACEHTLSLSQDPLPQALDSATCGQCAHTSGLWKCLTCGQQGCGRKQWDGSGGEGHGLAHWEATGHPLAVKLGTVQPDGTADVFCYACDEMRLDPSLPAHLLHLGLDVQQASKTERSMAELQLEHNLTHDFAMHSAEGQEYPPINDWPGLRNLGNSCYLASALQALLPHLPLPDPHHQAQCRRDPASCLLCQMAKLKQRIPKMEKAKSLSPWMFRAVVATGHPEFGSNHQQDAAEFIDHWLTAIQRSSGDPHCLDATLQWKQQTRITSNEQVTVRHETGLLFPVSLAACLQARIERQELEGQVSLLECLATAMQEETLGPERTKQSEFIQLAPLLVIVLGRSILRNWVPHKLDEAILVEETIDLAPFVAKELLPVTVDDGEGDQFDSVAVEQLTGMGFSVKAAKKALKACEGNVEMAVAWLFDNPVDDASEEADEGSLSLLLDAGFTRAQAIQALKACNGSVERAFDHLLSRFGVEERMEDGGAALPTVTEYRLQAFIAHRGPSLHCGHYIACVYTEDHGWIMLNDERVVAIPATEAMKMAQQAYVYCYQKLPGSN